MPFTLQNFYIMLLGIFSISGIAIVAGIKDLINSVKGKIVRKKFV